MTLYGPDDKKVFEVTDARGIVPGGGITVGNLEAKEKLRETIGRWEKYRNQVESEMAWKGFTQEEVEVSLDTIDSMICFYDDLLEKLE